MPQLPQGPQAPQGKERILRLDGSIVDEFGNVVQPGGPSLTPMLENPDSRNTGEMTRDAAAAMFKGIGALAPLAVPGGGLGAMAARTLLGSAPSVIGDFIEGDDPVDSSMGNLAGHAAAEVVGSGIAKATPYAALASGLVFKDLGKRGAAFNRDAATRRFPILPGASEKRMEGALKEGRQAIEGAESAIPGRPALKNVQENARKDMLSPTSSGKSERPLSQRMEVESADQEMLVEHALLRNPLFQGQSPQQALAQFNKLSPQVQQQILDSTTLSYRELAELARGMRTGDVGRMKHARFEGEHIVQDSPANAQRKMNFEDEVFRELDTADPTGAAKEARRKFADLKTMERANEELRGGLGAATIRGAAGATTAGTLGRLAGVGGGMTAGTLLALLPPRLVSALGLVGSETVRNIPGAYRGAEAIDDLSGEKSKERKAKLRKP